MTLLATAASDASELLRQWQALSPSPWWWFMAAFVAAWFLAWRWSVLRREVRALRTALHGERVRGGTNSEALAPLLDDFPVDIQAKDSSTVFLGQPIDYIHFDPARGVTFIEVKSGNSQLSAKQRQLRDHVEAGRVRWSTYRVR